MRGYISRHFVAQILLLPITNYQLQSKSCCFTCRFWVLQFSFQNHYSPFVNWGLVIWLLVSLWDHFCHYLLFTSETWEHSFLSTYFFLLVQNKLNNQFTNCFLIINRYTWKIYSERLMTLAGVYGFWKYVSKLERRETRRYLEMFYILKFRDLVCTFVV